MQALQRSYHGFNLVLELNADRILFVVTLGAALLAGAYLASF